MSSSPLTVIMPVYNGAAYLREAIASVLAQEGVEFEFLIGDNASTDDSVAIIESYFDPRIRLIRHKCNLGMFGNLNELLNEAQHDLIQILCCDDALLPGCLAAQRDFMSRHSEVAFARCRNTSEHDFRKNPSRRYEVQLPDVLHPRANVLAFIAFGCVVGSLSNAIVRRHVALKHGGFRTDLPYTGDYEFWVRLALLYPMGLNKRELVFVRVHDLQASNLLKQRSDHLWQTDLVLRILFAKVADRDKALCKLNCSLFFACQQFRSAVEVWRAGHRIEALEVCMHRTWAYPWPIILLYFVFGYRYRWGHAYVSRRQFERIYSLNCAESKVTGSVSV